MNTLTNDNTALASVAEYAYHQHCLMADFGQVEQASVWYHDAAEVARQVASNMTIDMERAACIVAAFSPRERWSVNVRKALQYSIGMTPAGLSNNLAMADASLVHGFDALKGQKTNAFARAIAGDTDAVVIDVWMMRAAGMQTDSPNKTQYNILSDAVRKVAGEFHLTPRTAQALIWIVKRGSAA
jgi:hypothetical protein